MGLFRLYILCLLYKISRFMNVIITPKAKMNHWNDINETTINGSIFMLCTVEKFAKTIL